VARGDLCRHAAAGVGKVGHGPTARKSGRDHEARVTLIDAALAAAVLIGIGLNALFGWWWADPIAGSVIVYYGLTEGRVAWKHAGARFFT
jgi:divalent metal cation (Fe/Co/Zn/Cd) transporter